MRGNGVCVFFVGEMAQVRDHDGPCIWHVCCHMLRGSGRHGFVVFSGDQQGLRAMLRKAGQKRFQLPLRHHLHGPVDVVGTGDKPAVVGEVCSGERGACTLDDAVNCVALGCSSAKDGCGKGKRCNGFGQKREQDARDTVKSIEGCVDADGLRDGNQFCNTQGDRGPCGMADDGSWLQVFGNEQGDDIFGHIIKVAAALCAQAGETLTGQVDGYDAVTTKMRDQVLPAMGRSASAVKQQEGRAGAYVLDMPLMGLADDKTRMLGEGPSGAFFGPFHRGQLPKDVLIAAETPLASARGRGM